MVMYIRNMKTLDECKREICARFACPDWKTMIETCRRSKDDKIFNHVVDSLCELYAKKVAIRTREKVKKAVASI